MLSLYLVQMEVVLNNKAANFKKVRQLLAESRSFAERKGTSLIVLPEMFATGYIPEAPAKYAEDFSSASAGETAKFLSDLANETGCAVLGAGISFAPAATVLQNHSSLYIPGNMQEAACYNKRKPFFPEVNFIGDDSASLFKIDNWNAATAICYDLRFPELFRDAVKAGAQLMTVQAAWPAVRKEHWITLLKARAIENQMYIAAVNQTTVPSDGFNKDSNVLPLGGNSMIISPTGEVLASASDLQNDHDGTSEGVISATIFSAPQEEYRKSFPVLKGIVQNGMI